MATSIIASARIMCRCGQVVERLGDRVRLVSRGDEDGDRRRRMRLEQRRLAIEEHPDGQERDEMAWDERDERDAEDGRHLRDHVGQLADPGQR
jgi:hypothetical protein